MDGFALGRVVTIYLPSVRMIANDSEARIELYRSVPDEVYQRSKETVAFRPSLDQSYRRVSRQLRS